MTKHDLQCLLAGVLGMRHIGWGPETCFKQAGIWLSEFERYRPIEAEDRTPKRLEVDLSPDPTPAIVQNVFHNPKPQPEAPKKRGRAKNPRPV